MYKIFVKATIYDYVTDVVDQRKKEPLKIYSSSDCTLYLQCFYLYAISFILFSLSSILAQTKPKHTIFSNNCLKLMKLGSHLITNNTNNNSITIILQFTRKYNSRYSFANYCQISLNTINFCQQRISKLLKIYHQILLDIKVSQHF